MNNFLSIVWYRVLPSLYGGQKGIAQFNNYLGKKVSLTCLCPVNNTPDEYLSYTLLNILPVSRLQFWNSSIRKRILQLVRQHSFTHVIIEHPYHAWIGKYKQTMGFRFIVHAHNIEHLRMKARGKLWWTVVKRTERKAFAAADHILFKTEADRATAIQLFALAPEKCLIVPFGTTETHQPERGIELKEAMKKEYGITQEEKIILFAGTLDYEPNARAIDNIVRYIIPLLQKKKFPFRLFICGALPEDRLKELNVIPGIIATGFVPSLKQYMITSDVFINPVVTGSGVQTKNIEAIAHGCNVVTTAFAASGLPAYLDNIKTFISNDNDWEDFANNILAASSLKTEVPQKFYVDYNWQNIIENLFQQLSLPG